MSKSFDIVMAGLISGIVALTTGFLGVAGTVIGAVLGAILYQVLSIFVKEPLENSTMRRVENELVYVIPLVLIAIFLVIFIVALLHSYMMYSPDFLEFFRQLEAITNNNLVRFMGIGLVAMGLYPLIQPKVIERKYGLIIFISGIVLLIRGLLDLNVEFFYYYSEVFQSFDIIVMGCVLLALLFIIIKILFESISLYTGRNKNKNLKNFDHVANEKNDLNINLKIIKADIKDKSIYFEGNDRKLNDHAKTIKSNIENTKNKIDHKINENIHKNNGFNKETNNKLNNDNNNINNNINDKTLNKRNIESNKTIKTSKTSTMSKNRKYFKR